MTQDIKFCRFCGAPLEPDMKKCEGCGQPVEGSGSPVEYMRSEPEPALPATQPEAPTPPPVEPAPISPPPSRSPVQPTAQPAKKGGFPVWAIIALVVVFLCLCVSVIIGVVAARNFLTTRGPAMVATLTDELVVTMPVVVEQFETAAATFQEQEAQQTPEPVIVEQPTLAMPPATETAGQSRTDNTLTDDFSSNRFEWLVDMDEISRQDVENGGYYIHVLEDLYIVWASLPVDFFPTTIEFDAQVEGDVNGGTYGVLCHMQDRDNYHYVEIDLSDYTYRFGVYQNDEDTALLEEGWGDASYLNTNRNAVNRIMVSCDPDLISLFINNQLERQVSLDPFANAGTMALFASTWDGLGDSGYKVIFDNLYAFKPVQ